ncbi:DegV family protein with EDD domain [Orenia metallireducens]|jgi:DegV family protein with EDD domain|uniref:EDD domain protein, DegV family n=1 Tax=Orenia metallireducens TaxID=1413210 RepID=A0A285HP03_9FIRM|nr:DegV family protein [Orenia metallireducens]PRX27979.1 DegV family protein with EDD domain [Orenia metallireducens]SNY37480.1 EDD domain protein, DegV family [Orenia metallireducens]
MDQKIALLTDSTSDIPKEILEEKQIHSLPLKIIYKDKQYTDRVDIQPEEIYNRFAEEIPSTSMPSPNDATNILLKLKEEGFTHVIAVHISSGLSGTYNMVRMIAQQVEGITVEVIDSKALSMGLGRLVLYAADLIEKGLNFADIIKKIEKKMNNTEVFFVVKSLKYLIEGGRIGKVSGTIGELLNLKPIISIDDDGQYYTLKKSRGRKKSINTIYNIVKDKITEGISTVDVMHGAAYEEAKELLEKIKKIDNVKDTFFGQIGPSMVVHTGPGLIGIVVSKVD